MFDVVETWVACCCGGGDVMRVVGDDMDVYVD